MADDENFADYPKSLAEIRSDRSQNSADWTPRDALIDLLRDIDSGKFNPKSLMIVHKVADGEHGYFLGTTSAGVTSIHEGVGMLMEALTKRLDP